MRIIDSDDYIEHGIDTMFFPGGEPHCKVPKKIRDNWKENFLFLKLRTWNDVGLAACVSDCMHESLAFIPYFPGARQDKPNQGPFTLSLIGRLFDRWVVNVFDPHSGELQDRIDSNVWMPEDLDVPVKRDVVGIIAPDAGAVERATRFKRAFYPHLGEVYVCSKHRDPQSGALSGYNMPMLLDEGRYIVVDDICDGGGTFNLLAEAYKKQDISSKSSLDLFVSHGIFSKGINALDPIYGHITTTDSWCRLSASTGRLTVLPLAPLFPKIMEFCNAS